MKETETLNEALFKLQGVLRGVKRDTKNSHFKTAYASLEQVSDTIRPHMQDLGLFWMQWPGKVVDGAIEVTTRISHVKGEFIEFTMEMPMAKRDPQGAGSALTYAMRYSLMAALGLPPTDDDAEMAIDRNNSRPEPDTPAPAVKSRAQLKREQSWEGLSNELAQDMVDVRSIVSLNQVKDIYRKKAVELGWPKAWLAQLADEFEYYEKGIKASSALEAGE